MKEQPKFRIGQGVILVEGFGRRGKDAPDILETITKVGRKNVYIRRHGREIPFSIETGQEVRRPNAPGLGDRILTFEEHAERRRRSALTDRLADMGIAPTGYGGFRQTTDTLERMIEAVERGES